MPKLKNWRFKEQFWAQKYHERTVALLQQQIQQNSNTKSDQLDQETGKVEYNYVKSKKERARDNVLVQRAMAHRLRFPDEPEVPATEERLNIYAKTIDQLIAEASTPQHSTPDSATNNTTNTGNPSVKRKTNFGMSLKPRKLITFDQNNTLILEPTTEASAWEGIEECHGITLKPEEPESIALRVKTRASPSRRRHVWPAKLRKTGLGKNSAKKKTNFNSQKSKNLKKHVMPPVVRLPRETHLYGFHRSGNKISVQKSGGIRTGLCRQNRRDVTETDVNRVSVHLKNRPNILKKDNNSSKHHTASSMLPYEDALSLSVPEVLIPGEIQSISIPCPTCEMIILGTLDDLQQHLQIHNQALVPIPNGDFQNDTLAYSKTIEPVMKTEELNAAIADPNNLVIQREVSKPTKSTTFKFICQKCGHGFRDSSALTIHCRTHSGIKPFPCELCNMHYRQKAHRDKHYKSKIHLKNSTSLNVTTIDNRRPSQSQTTHPVVPMPGGLFLRHRFEKPPSQPEHEFWKSKLLNGPAAVLVPPVSVQGEKDPLALSYDHNEGLNNCPKSQNPTVFIYNYNSTNKPL